VNQFRAQVAGWLSRAVPERAVNDCFGTAVSLATDVGLQRAENQDRVAALRLISGKTSRSRLFAAAVADGMGGMRDGGKCATLAHSAFFATLVQSGPQRLEELAMQALKSANDAVFAFSGGKGGTTFSAILMDETSRAVIVHVGDSRVYSFGHRKSVERLTVDDSLAELVGGEGRDLLQYAGMGEGIKPQVVALPDGVDLVAITTDGIHFVEAKTFEQVLVHSSTPRSASERLAALSRWCGGHDNASSAMIGIKSVAEELQTGAEPSVQLWDPFGTLTTIWVKRNDDGIGEDRPKEIVKVEAPPQPIENRALTPERPTRAPSGSGKSKQSKRARRPKKERRTKEDIQLEIEIDQSPGSKKTE
jgi:serine/threonine protein phosphatase PrpC